MAVACRGGGERVVGEWAGGGGGGRAWGFRGSSSRAWCMGLGSLVLGALPWAVVVGCSTQRLFHTQARDRLTHGLSRDGVR